MSQTDGFLKLLENGQDNAMVRYTLGNLFFKQGKFDQAQPHLRKALEYDPEYSVAWKLLGRVLLEMNEVAEAQQVFAQGLEVANRRGDQQVVKEIQIYQKRLQKTQSD